MEYNDAIIKLETYISSIYERLNNFRANLDFMFDEGKKSMLNENIVLISSELEKIKEQIRKYDVNVTLDDLNNIIKNIIISVDKIENVFNTKFISKSKGFNDPYNDNMYINEYNSIIGEKFDENNICRKLINHTKNFSYHMYYQFLTAKFNNRDDKADERLLIDYIYVLSREDANYDPSNIKENEWSILYEQYCNFVMDYCIAKNDNIREAYRQGKIEKPKIEIKHIKGNINSQFSEEKNLIRINTDLCCHKPIKIAVAIRHELEHWYQSIITKNYSENLETHEKVYSNETGYIYKSYKQYHKMSKESVLKICRNLGKESIADKDVRGAAYSLMMVEHLARNAQSEFEADISKLIKKVGLESDIKTHEEISNDPVKENKEKYIGYKKVLDEFVSLITNNMEEFAGFIHEIDEETLRAIFYAMTKEEKEKLNVELGKIIDGSNQNSKRLRYIRQRLIHSMFYDRRIELENEREI